MLHAKSLLLLVATTALLPKTDDAVTLRWKPVADYKSVQELKMDIDVAGHAQTVQMNVHTKVKKIEEDGKYTTESVYKDFKVSVDGAEQPGPPEDPTVTVNYDEKGEIIPEKDAPPNPLDFVGYLMRFEPKDKVKVGDSWKIEKDTFEGSFKLEAKDKLDDVECYIVKGTVKLKGDGKSGSGTGTIWIKASDFDLLKADATFSDVTMGPGAPGANVKISVKKKLDK